METSRRFPRDTLPYDYQKYEGVGVPKHQNNYYARNNEDNLKSNQQYKYKIRTPLAAINWRRIGHVIDQIKENAIDRQFGALGGFLSPFTGFFSAVFEIASSSVNIHFFVLMTFQSLIPFLVVDENGFGNNIYEFSLFNPSFILYSIKEMYKYL